MIGAMLLQMTNGHEHLTLKILIFLIEGILPSGFEHFHTHGGLRSKLSFRIFLIFCMFRIF